MYEYIPKRKNKKAMLWTATAVLVAAVCFLSARYVSAYRWIIQLVAIVAATIAILFTGRYLLREYTYRLERHGAGLDLVVIERRGKREITVCRVGTEDILDAVKETAETKKKIAQKSKRLRRYDYCIDLGLDEALCLFVEEGEETVVVRFSPDETMTSLLLSCLTGTSEGAGENGRDYGSDSENDTTHGTKDKEI